MSSRLRLATTAAGGAAGALLAFFLDPQSGRRRRRQTVDRTAATARRTVRMLGRSTRRVGSRVDGERHRIMHALSDGGGRPPASDETLADRVRSELFRDADIPKGDININVERQGVVVLRGEVQRPEIIRDVETRVRRINGVRDVENLMHAPRTPARTRL